MIPRRPRLVDTPAFPAQVDIEVIPVTKLKLVLDTGIPLEFDLEAREDHNWLHDDKWLIVMLGERILRIAAHRILYIDTHPGSIKRQRQPPSPHV